VTTLEVLRRDFRFFHELTYPGEEPRWSSRARLLLSSRGLLLMIQHRAAQAAAGWTPRGRVGRLARRAAAVASGLAGYATRVLAKGEISQDAVLEPGVYVSHEGRVFLGAQSVGSGSVIHGRVTMGTSLLDRGKPEIGRDVWIGPRTVIAGRIVVGDGATILPDTVLTRSAPPGSVVKGNPAVFVRRSFDNSALRRTLSTDVADLLTKGTA
jgi:serine acetyltransferase